MSPVGLQQLPATPCNVQNPAGFALQFPWPHLTRARCVSVEAYGHDNKHGNILRDLGEHQYHMQTQAMCTLHWVVALEKKARMGGSKVEKDWYSP